jgi:hypothetical protein
MLLQYRYPCCLSCVDTIYRVDNYMTEGYTYNTVLYKLWISWVYPFVWCVTSTAGQQDKSKITSRNFLNFFLLFSFRRYLEEDGKHLVCSSRLSLVKETGTGVGWGSTDPSSFFQCFLFY